MPTALLCGLGPWQHRGFYCGGVAARTDLWGCGGGAWGLTVGLFMGSALVSCCLSLWSFLGGEEAGKGWPVLPLLLAAGYYYA